MKRLLSNAQWIETLTREAEQRKLLEEEGIRANLALIRADKTPVIISQEDLKNDDVHFT